MNGAIFATFSSITESTAFVLLGAKENRKSFLIVRLQCRAVRHHRHTFLDGRASLDSFIPSLQIWEIFEVLSLQLVQFEPRICGDVGYRVFTRQVGNLANALVHHAINAPGFVCITLDGVSDLFWRIATEMMRLAEHWPDAPIWNISHSSTL